MKGKTFKWIRRFILVTVCGGFLVVALNGPWPWKLIWGIYAAIAGRAALD